MWRYHALKLETQSEREGEREGGSERSACNSDEMETLILRRSNIRREARRTCEIICRVVVCTGQYFIIDSCTAVEVEL